MKANGLITTLHAAASASTTPGAVYATLADLSTHMAWAGEGTGDKKFRLLTLAQPGGSAVAGTRFSSTGVVQMGTFHDETVVTDATPASRFSFITESVLERPRSKAWRGWFEHRYTLTGTDGGTVINYECALHASNYVPYWWKLPMRPVTRFMVQRIATRTLRSLASIAQAPTLAKAGSTPAGSAAG